MIGNAVNFHCVFFFDSFFHESFDSSDIVSPIITVSSITTSFLSFSSNMSSGMYVFHLVVSIHIDHCGSKVESRTPFLLEIPNENGISLE